MSMVLPSLGGMSQQAFCSLGHSPVATITRADGSSPPGLGSVSEHLTRYQGVLFTYLTAGQEEYKRELSFDPVTATRKAELRSIGWVLLDGTPGSGRLSIHRLYSLILTVFWMGINITWVLFLFVTQKRSRLVNYINISPPGR